VSGVRSPVSKAFFLTPDSGHRTPDFGFLYATNVMNEIAGSRSRIIQVGGVVLVLGFLFLRQKYR
jgi:hypothetical protein